MNDNLMFREVAVKIADELDSRGFATDYREGADGLVEKIEEIIRKTLTGNVNFTEATEPVQIERDIMDLFDELIYSGKIEDGWNGDLQNQIS